MFKKYWYHSIVISSLYYLFVCILQRLMRDRKAFELRIPLILWNIMLATFSFIGLIRFSEVCNLFYFITLYIVLRIFFTI